VAGHQNPAADFAFDSNLKGAILLENTESKPDKNSGQSTIGTAQAAGAKTKPSRQRNVNLAFRVTEEEKALIDKRVAQTGMSNLRAYMVKMAIDGRVIKVELDSVWEMVRLLSNATNNINQITRSLHQTGSIHAADIAVMQGQVEEIWEQAKEVLQKLSKL